jgi:hypothetical protein
MEIEVPVPGTVSFGVSNLGVNTPTELHWLLYRPLTALTFQ